MGHKRSMLDAELDENLSLDEKVHPDRRKDKKAQEEELEKRSKKRRSKKSFRMG